MKKNVEKGVFRCLTARCQRRELSLRSHTFFFNSRLHCIQIMRLAHIWLSGASSKTAGILTGHGTECIAAFYRHFRHLVASSLTEQDQVIGGPGIVVQVDETKLGKRKYNMGHRVEGVWVLVGIEETNESKIFLVPVENRNSQTLTNVISSHVASGSILWTDCWKGYDSIKENLGLEHFTVNHSMHYKDPDTQVCTNRVEGLNNGLKLKIPVRNRVKRGIEGHLCEYIWRKLHKNNLWDSLIVAMRDVHYDIQ
jgi:transposase-like protein